MELHAKSEETEIHIFSFVLRQESQNYVNTAHMVVGRQGILSEVVTR